VPPPTPRRLFRLPIFFTAFRKTYALIDSGAASSFISTQLLAQLDPQLIQEDDKNFLCPIFTTASNEIIKTYGCFNIKFTLDDFILRQDFFSSSVMRESIILGADFLVDNKMILDMGAKTLAIPYSLGYKTIHLEEHAPVGGLFNISTAEKKKWNFKLDHLQEPVLSQLQELLDEFHSSFAEKFTELGCASVLPAKIITKGEPFYNRPYRCPPNMKSQFKEMIQDLLDGDIIEPAISEYSSPVFMVPKKDPTKNRFLIDLRQLNAQTQRDKFPIPNIFDMIQDVGAAAPKVFSVVDLASGFYQVEIFSPHRHKTAFATEFGHFMSMTRVSIVPIFKLISFICAMFSRSSGRAI